MPAGPGIELVTSIGSTVGPLAPPGIRSAAAATWALFTGIGLLMLGNGMQGSLIGIRSELEGFGTGVSGAIMTAYFIGFLAGTRAATRAVASVGHVRVFAALASMASSAALVHAVAVHPVAWFLMRFTTGLCMAGLYVVAESWISGLSTTENRGRMLAVYMVVSMGGLAGGQLLLNVAAPEGFELFVIASVLISLALVPVSLSASGAPSSVPAEQLSIRQLAREVPTGVTMSMLSGLSAGAMLGMGAVYATRAGLSPSQTAVFLGAPMAGGVVLQLPIGTLSDRLSRRGVMLVVAVAASATAALLLVLPVGGRSATAAMFALGGFSFPLYALGIAYTHDWIRAEQATGASAALVTVNGIGAIAGPPVAATLIAVGGNQAFFVSLVATHGLMAAVLSYRILFRDGLPIARQGRFIPIPARASANAIALVTRRRRDQRPPT